MPSPLVECIPNFSEARRPEVIAEILAAFKGTGVILLDTHSDSDHNRSVVTLIGPPAEVEESMFHAIRKAAGLINLDQHSGQHPRIGATDVVPFVPIRDITMQECVEMARRLGKRVGTELGIPVYLYEEASQNPKRKNLEDIRRGEYEALKLEMGANPDRDPDFGPAKVGTAGATVIGARQPLIAFNIYLSSDDVSIAARIAKVVRHSNGGLRFVKAMGVLVDGRAQVSMNLTNYRQTPIARVVEMVRREAERYGVGIHHSELVGLIPQEALVDAVVWYTQLDQFEPEQILERRMEEALRGKPQAETILQESFLEELARGTAAPGGGSAAAFAGAAAAALAAMVARLTTNRKKYAAVESDMWLLIDQAENLRRQLTQAIKADTEAFERLMAANKLPKDTPEQIAARETAVQAAAVEAIRVPLTVCAGAVAALELALQAAAQGNLNAITDAGSGAALARAAITAAGLNVRINCQGLSNQIQANEFIAEVKDLEQKADRLEEEMRLVLAERGGLSL